jgi:hypothetical protein
MVCLNMTLFYNIIVYKTNSLFKLYYDPVNGDSKTPTASSAQLRKSATKNTKITATL